MGDTLQHTARTRHTLLALARPLKPWRNLNSSTAYFRMMAEGDTEVPPQANHAHESALEDGSDKQTDSLDNPDVEKANQPQQDQAVEAAAKAEADVAGPPKHQLGGPPPNGGTQAWLQVLGSWMLFFNTWASLSQDRRLADRMLMAVFK